MTIRLCGVLLACIPMLGCVHLRDNVKANEANRSRVGFDESLAASIAGDVVGLTDAAAETNRLLLTEVASISTRAQVRALGDRSITELWTTARAELTEVRSAQADLSQALDAAKDEHRTVLARLASTQSSRATLVDAANAAAERAARAEATRRVFTRVAVALASGNSRDVRAAASEGLGEQVPMNVYEINSSGRFAVKETRRVTTARLLGVDARAAEVLKLPDTLGSRDVQSAIDEVAAVLRATSATHAEPSDSDGEPLPSASAAVLGIGLLTEISASRESEIKASLQAAQLEIAMLQGRGAFLRERASSLEDLTGTRGRLGDAKLEYRSNVESLAAGNLAGLAVELGRLLAQNDDDTEEVGIDHEAADRLFARTAEFANDDDHRNGARALVEELATSLAIYANAAFISEAVDQEQRIEMATFPRRSAAIRADGRFERREFAISRGIEGLVLYHESGLTGEDFEPVARIAQLVILALIAEGVD